MNNLTTVQNLHIGKNIAADRRIRRPAEFYRIPRIKDLAIPG